MNTGPYVVVASTEAFDRALKACDCPAQEAVVRGFLDVDGEQFLGQPVADSDAFIAVIDNLFEALDNDGVQWHTFCGPRGDTVLVFDDVKGVSDENTG